MTGAADAHTSLQSTVDEITGYSRRTRRLVRGLIAVTVACVLLVAVVGYLYFQLHASQVDNCAAGNQTKVQQEHLWDTLFALAAKGGSKPSAESQRLTAEFLGDVRITYASSDCPARYPFW